MILNLKDMIKYLNELLYLFYFLLIKISQPFFNAKASEIPLVEKFLRGEKLAQNA